jgi:hypothetical protein
MEQREETAQAMAWHDGDTRKILEMLQQGAVLIVGGRGTGKTTLLDQVAERLEAEGEREGLVLNGRDTSEERRRLKKETDEKRSYSMILIDDLDALLTAGPDDRAEDLHAVVACLWWQVNNQRPSQPGRRARFVATSSIEFQGPAAYRLAAAIERKGDQIKWRDISSYFTEGLARHRIDLWKAGWQGRWLEEFETAFGTDLPGELGGRWARLILKLTGGHPALFGPMVNRLRELCAAEAGTLEVLERRLIGRGGVEDGGACNDDEMTRYIEDQLWADPMRRIRSILRRLKDSSNGAEAAAYTALVEIAADHSEAGAKPPRDPNVRRLLKDEALVYEDMKTGNFHIPGALIRGQILQAVTRSQPVFGLVPDAEDEDAGELVVQSGAGEERMAFSGVGWRVLREIYRAQGGLVSAAELKEKANLSDEKRGVANAIQRLQSKLRVYGDVIINEYGKGYRFAGR